MLRWNIAGCCQQTFENKKFINNTQQCFAFKPQANFTAHNLNFHWMWRLWVWIRSIFLNLFHFKGVTDLETHMVYFTLPKRGCENLNFPVHLSWMTYTWKKIKTSSWKCKIFIHVFESETPLKWHKVRSFKKNFILKKFVLDFAKNNTSIHT